MPSLFVLLLVIGPLAAALAILVRKPERAVAAVDQADAWLVRRRREACDAEDFFNRFVLRPLLWPFERIGNATAGIADPFLQAAVRVLAAGWCVALFIAVIEGLPFLIGGLVVVIGFLAAIQHLLSGQGASKPMYHGRDAGEAGAPTQAPDPLDDEPGFPGGPSRQG